MTAPVAPPVVLFVLPLAAAVLSFVLPRWSRVIALAASALLFATALWLLTLVLRLGDWRHDIGGWSAPLGTGWAVDGLAATLVLLTAMVGLAGTVFHAARAATGMTAHDPRLFWPLWLFLWGGLNALFLSADLFNIYVAFELVSIASVGLIALAGGAAQAAAWRYLLATLFGSTLYLLGIALLYGSTAVLDLALLAERLEPDGITTVAAALITTGLLLKAAMFPLHFWLPAAHGRALPAVSAMLSGVVVAAAWSLLLRLWLGPLAPLLDSAAAPLFGALGAAAVLWGGMQALLQRHLKMLIAYSTVSQFGLALLVFPLAAAGAHALALSGAVMLVVAHGLAKAALFLAAGTLIVHHRGGRIGALAGDQRGVMVAWAAFAVAASSLVGLPPTGGFVGKWWLAQAALAADGWLWLVVLLLGTALSAACLWRPLRAALSPGASVDQRLHRIASRSALAALLLAGSAAALGLAAPIIRQLLDGAASA